MALWASNSTENQYEKETDLELQLGALSFLIECLLFSMDFCATLYQVVRLFLFFFCHFFESSANQDVPNHKISGRFKTPALTQERGFKRAWNDVGCVDATSGTRRKKGQKKSMVLFGHY